MIQKQQVQDLVEQFLGNSDYALQTLEIDKENNILVEIDRLGTVDVDYCAELNRFLVEHLDSREDYSLEVGSVSLTAPFISKIQYEKNIGHDVEVLVHGKKVRGQLVSVDDETFSVDVESMVLVEGKKRRQKQIETIVYRYDEVTQVQYDLKF